MSCDEARVELSALLDGEVRPAAARAIAEHLDSCEACRAHEATLARARRALRAQPAERVPDLSAAIMARVRVEAAERAAARRARRRSGAVAAVAAALVVVGASLPGSDRPPATAGASEISEQVRAAARSLHDYRARFEVVERGWHRAVPLRRFTANVSFDAPERLRLTVRDSTDYPHPDRWPVNDVDLVANATRWWIREPTTCPTEALPGCSVEAGTEERTILNRQPFDGASSLPTDIIVPLETLATSHDFEVLGRASVLGRDTYRIAVPYRQAAPLVVALEPGGTWRSFRPSDRVEIWIDERTWFPLRFEVVRGPRSEVLMRAAATAFSEPDRLRPGLFRAPRSGLVRDGGFRARPRAAFGGPSFVAGLEPYRRGVTAQGQTIVAYAEGMTWLKVVRGGRGQTPLSPRTPAEEVRLADGGIAYYQPATPALSGEAFRRRVTILGRRTSVQLESNLTRAALLDVAASVGVRGRRLPQVQRAGGLVIRRVSPSAAARIAWVALPTELPSGYRATSAFSSRARDGRRTVTVFFRHAQADFDGFGIRVTQSRPVSILPPTSETFAPMSIGNEHGRWSAERGELEWIDHGVYRAVAAPAFGAATAARVARSER